MAKSVTMAYVCWLVGGLFGLHHFYLGRDKQALVWLVTLGGFVVGAARDAFKMREYVLEANYDNAEYVERTERHTRLTKAPAFVSTRFFSCLLVATFYTFVLRHMVVMNDEGDGEFATLRLFVQFVATPTLVATLVYLVGTEGPYRCHIKWPMLGAYLMIAIDWLRLASLKEQSYVSAPLAATLMLNWNVRWATADERRQEKARRGRCTLKRVAVFATSCLVVSLLAGAFVLNNTQVVVHGRQMPLSEAIREFLNSSEFAELRELFVMSWNYYRAHGFQQLFAHIFYGAEADALARAYEVFVFHLYICILVV